MQVVVEHRVVDLNVGFLLLSWEGGTGRRGLRVALCCVGSLIVLFVRLIPRDLATECILLYVFEKESGLDDLHLLTALLVLCHVVNRDGNRDIDFYMEGRNDGTEAKVCDK